MVSIRLAGVTKRFGQTVAVDNVSLEVNKGELFFLLGPSGCGKTTILRMVAGFCEPDAGDIYFNDKPIAQVPAHKRNTALVFQNYALWPHMSVSENVAYGLRERKVSKAERQERVAEALRHVRMEPYADRMPNQLSGGQQQRVALARALVIHPDAVLMDEPLSNLDARLRLEMRFEIRRIHESTGVTMLYVTHDQKEALSMAQRVAVMSMGRVEQMGDPRSVYRYPANRFVANFIGETNLIPGTLLGASGEWARVRTALGELRARAGAALKGAGSGVEVMVRPESLRFGAAGENPFKAKVSASLYLGEAEQFVLEAGGITLRAVVSNPGSDAPRAGTETDVRFDAADAVALPRQEGAEP